MDNPLAFPTYDHHGNGQQFLAEVGMTLRDFFAAKAMQVDYELAKNYSDPDWRYGVASDAYKMADAMLRVRQSK